MKTILTLTAFEYKKLARQKSTLVLALAAILFSVLAAVLNTFGGSYYSCIGTGLSAPEGLAADRQVIREHKGIVDDEYLKTVTAKTQAVLGSEDSYFISADGVRRMKPEMGIRYKLPFYHVYFFLGDVAGKMYGDSAGAYPQDRLFPSQMENFYENYKALLLDSINADSKLTQAEKMKQSEMVSRIRTPFYNDYNQGFSSFRNMLPMVGMIILTLISVFCAGIFGNEYQERTDALVLSSKYGKNKCIAAKLLMGLSLSALTCAVLCLVYLFSFLSFHGASGAGTPLQFLQGFGCSVYPVTVVQSVLITIAATCFVSMMFAALVMLLSAFIRRPYVSVTISLLAALFPVFIPASDDRFITQLISLLPLKAFDYNSMFSEYFYSLGKIVFTPAAFYILLSLAAGIILLPAVYQGFRRHQVR